MAARLYASAAVPSKLAAARAVGLSPTHMYLMTTKNEESKRLINEVDQRILEGTVEMSTVLREIGREAIVKLRNLMNAAASEQTQLRAAQDLADRNPETSKVQRHEIVATHITPTDAKALAAALVESARVKEQFSGMAEGDFVKVDPEKEAHRATLRLIRGTGEEPFDESPQSADEGITVEAPDSGGEDQANAPRQDAR